MTYKEIIDSIVAIASSNLGIASTNFAETFEVVQLPNINYPHFFLEQPTIAEVTNSREMYTIAFLVIDRGLEDLSDRLDRLTKCKWLAESIIYKIDQDFPDLLTTSNDWSATNFQEGFQDRVWGWRFEFKIEQDVNYSKCELPYDPIVLEQPELLCP